MIRGPRFFVCKSLVWLLVSACAAPPPPPDVAPPPAGSAAAAVVAPSASAVAPKPVVPDAPKLAAMEEAPCRIRTSTLPSGTIRPTWQGARFATFENAREVELRIAEGKAVVAVATDELEIVGEADPKSFGAVPTEDALVFGYLRPLRANLGETQGAEATLRFTTPRSVHPTATIVKAYPCNALTLGQRPGTPRAGASMMLGDGLNVPLVATPGGPPVATIATPPKPKAQPKPKRGHGGYGIASPEAFDLPNVFELDRKGAQVHVRIVGDRSEVEGFLPASALRKPGGGGFGLIGLLGTGAGSAAAETERRLRCDRSVRIYLRLEERIVQIGAYKPNGLIVLPLPPKRAAADAAAGPVEGERPLPEGEQRVLLGDRSSGLWGDLEGGTGGIGGIGGIGLGHIGRAPASAPPPPAPPPPPPRPVAFVRTEDIRACPAVVPKKP